MPIIEGRGNLGGDPELKIVTVDGEPRKVLNFSVFLSNRKLKGDDWVEDGGFFVECAYWGDRAEHAANLLRKGVGVFVSGNAKMEPWLNSDQIEQISIKMTVDVLFLDLRRIESVQFKQKKDAANGN